ncbi:MAG: hypothetical protein IPM74_12180 [Crocinitomicaceae bacterium]|nr:hypothetical protein [Crocinitomicaceae bacterium]MBK8926632.1 hypothetical protein [Crocinitomicaceae bacterium]
MHHLSLRLFFIAGILFNSFLVMAKKIDIQLGTIKLMSDKIEIKIPSHFSALLDHEMKTNFTTERMPKVAYGDSLRESTLAFYMKKSEMTDATVTGLKAAYLSEFLSQDLKLKELSNGVDMIDGRDVGFLGIMHRSPEKKYRFFFFTIYKGMILSGEFITPKKGYKLWLQPCIEMMRSMKILG